MYSTHFCFSGKRKGLFLLRLEEGDGGKGRNWGEGGKKVIFGRIV
jgi:hypothetical protein